MMNCALIITHHSTPKKLLKTDRKYAIFFFNTEIAFTTKKTKTR